LATQIQKSQNKNIKNNHYGMCNEVQSMCSFLTFNHTDLEYHVVESYWLGQW